VRVVVSGGLDEHDIAALLAGGAPIDAFGVGTRLNVSADAPSLDLVYKLVRYAGRDVLKLSEGKETWVGAKALYRSMDAAGRAAGDVLAVEDEPAVAETESLLEPVVRAGELLRQHPSLAEVRRHCAAQLSALPEGLRRLQGHETYVVRPSDTLHRRQHEALRRPR
jgi:nicotinate phosphoribosyltransferase